MPIKILADSLNPYTGNRITTYQIEGFPKNLLAEFNTHGLICRNWESSRARPVQAVIKQVLEDPFIPIFTTNQKGMTGEIINNPDEELRLHLNLRDQTVTFIESALSEGLNIHKQNINRYLEPWMKVSGIATSTFWDNPDPKNPGFFQLRNHKDAQPDFQIFAEEMEYKYHHNQPTPLVDGAWHRPWKDSIEVCTARAASVSYANHDRDIPEQRRIELHDQLRNSKHLSPFSHCALCVKPGMDFRDHIVFDPWNILESVQNSGLPLVEDPKIISTAQYGGFLQYRKLVEKSIKL